MSSGHTLGHVTNTAKMHRLPGKFQDIKKFITSEKEHDFEKGIYSSVSNIGFNQNLLKKA